MVCGFDLRRAAPPLVSLKCGEVWCVVRQPEAAHQHLELAFDLRLSGFGHRAVFALLGSFLLQVFAQEAASSYNVSVFAQEAAS